MDGQIGSYRTRTWSKSAGSRWRGWCGTATPGGPCGSHGPPGKLSPGVTPDGLLRGGEEDDLLGLDLVVVVEQVQAGRREGHRAAAEVRLHGQQEQRVAL